jgi:hypothetical protein
VAPVLWLSQLRLRRLPGPRQLQSNMSGFALGLLAMVLAGWFLFARA